jgi:uncharacterized protein YlaI
LENEIECILCKKKGKIEENISFYINWLEYEPGVWICKDCKEKFVNPSLIVYKFNTITNALHKESDDEETE